MMLIIVVLLDVNEFQHFPPCNHTICLSIYFTKKKETNCTSLLNLLRKSGNYTFKELIYCKYYMRLVSKLLGLGVLFKNL